MMQTLNCIPRELINNLNKVERVQILRTVPLEAVSYFTLTIYNITNKKLIYRGSGTLCSPKRSPVDYTKCLAKLVAGLEEAI